MTKLDHCPICCKPKNDDIVGRLKQRQKWVLDRKDEVIDRQQEETWNTYLAALEWAIQDITKPLPPSPESE